MSSPPAAVLLVGTADTKSDEIAYLQERIRALGAVPLTMDVGVLAAGHAPVDISNAEVARAAGSTIEAVIASGDENTAMTLMAQGAAAVATRLHAEGRMQGLLALGGSMGTDLAFDVAAALPLGVPKVVISTIAHSHLIPPERITPDLIMVLWAGGLYGLNSLCKSALAQGAGAVVGAMQAAQPPRMSAPGRSQALVPEPFRGEGTRVHGPDERPLVGMTSLGKSCLAYMVRLKPALEQRGYEVAVFHTTGMGGRAFEALARAGRFCAVMDFSLQELSNHLGGSVVTSGPDRLTGAGASGTPQLVAPGAVDMVDFPAWQPVPAVLEGRAVHVHNRLIASATSAPPLRRRIAAEIGARLASAKGPTTLLLPTRGIEQWDQPGEPLHDPEGLLAFLAAMRASVAGSTKLVELDAHINDEAFCGAALAQFDRWVAEGVVPPGRS